MTAHELIVRGLAWLSGVRASRIVMALLLAGSATALWWAWSWDPWLLTVTGLLWLPAGLLLVRLHRYEDAAEWRRLAARDRAGAR